VPVFIDELRGDLPHFALVGAGGVDGNQGRLGSLIAIKALIAGQLQTSCHDKPSTSSGPHAL